MKSVLKIFLVLIISLFTVGCGNSNSDTDTNIVNVEKISTSEVKEIIDNNNEDYIIVDVREEYEYNEGHLPNAVNIPLGNINSINYEKEKIIIVYCRSGSRSSEAASKLKNMGYTVKDMGGIIDWNYEIKKG